MLTDNINRPQLPSNFSPLNFQTPVSYTCLIILGFKWNTASDSVLWLVLLMDCSYNYRSIINFKIVWTRLPIWLICNRGSCSYRLLIYNICKNKVWIQRQQNWKFLCVNCHDCIRSILHLHKCLLSCMVNLHYVYRTSSSFSSCRFHYRRNRDC